MPNIDTGHAFFPVRGIRYLKDSAEVEYGKCLRDGLAVIKTFSVKTQSRRRRRAGIERDMVQGAEYYGLSAERGHSFGRCRETGIAMKRDSNRVAQYYRLSGGQGVAEARTSQKRCLEALNHCVINTRSGHLEKWVEDVKVSEFAWKDENSIIYVDLNSR
jgi:TPR repeat protein